jgi:DNA-binding NarL/FixJ family response regulator
VVFQSSRISPMIQMGTGSDVPHKQKECADQDLNLLRSEIGPTRSLADADTSPFLRPASQSAARNSEMSLRIIPLSGRFGSKDSAGNRQPDRSFEIEDAHMITQIVLADSETIFRAGAAKALDMEHDLCVVSQCADLDSMYDAVVAFPGSIVLFASLLKPEQKRLFTLLEAAGSQGIVIADGGLAPSTYMQQGLRGVVFRSVTPSGLVECVRKVAAGGTWVPPVPVPINPSQNDLLGAQVRDRLTPREMRIVALVVQGCRGQEIANRLGTSEQVIKNYLRTVYVKTGASDRLDLAMFTIRHPALAKAVAEVGIQLEAERQASQGAVA